MNLIVRERRHGHQANHGDVNVTDLHAAVLLLEQTPAVESWQLTRITNVEHAVPPRGMGFGVAVSHSAPPGRQPITVWIKAGSDRTILQAAELAVAGLKARLLDDHEDGAVGGRAG
jgi:hypothetical protein